MPLFVIFSSHAFLDKTVLQRPFSLNISYIMYTCLLLVWQLCMTGYHFSSYNTCETEIQIRLFMNPLLNLCISLANISSSQKGDLRSCFWRCGFHPECFWAWIEFDIHSVWWVPWSLMSLYSVVSSAPLSGPQSLIIMIYHPLVSLRTFLSPSSSDISKSTSYGGSKSINHLACNRTWPGMDVLHDNFTANLEVVVPGTGGLFWAEHVWLLTATRIHAFTQPRKYLVRIGKTFKVVVLLPTVHGWEAH